MAFCQENLKRLHHYLLNSGLFFPVWVRPVETEVLRSGRLVHRPVLEHTSLWASLGCASIAVWLRTSLLFLLLCITNRTVSSQAIFASSWLCFWTALQFTEVLNFLLKTSVFLLSKSVSFLMIQLWGQPLCSLPATGKQNPASSLAWALGMVWRWLSGMWWRQDHVWASLAWNLS